MGSSRPRHLSLSSPDRYSWRIIDFTLVCLMISLLGALLAIAAAILPEIITF